MVNELTMLGRAKVNRESKPGNSAGSSGTPLREEMLPVRQCHSSTPHSFPRGRARGKNQSTSRMSSDFSRGMEGRWEGVVWRQERRAPECWRVGCGGMLIVFEDLALCAR